MQSMKKDVAKLKEDQLKLSKKIITKEEIEKKELIAGVDQVYLGKKIISAIIVFDISNNKIIESRHSVSYAKVPFIPGYLGYREGPAIFEAFNQLDNRPDILLVDGLGIAHPRKMGLASHAGLMLDIPTIGVAKSMIGGEIKDNKIYFSGELRGRYLKTRDHANPIIISPGYKISLRTSVELVEKCLFPPHKYPEPLHLAHSLAKKTMKRLEDDQSSTLS